MEKSLICSICRGWGYDVFFRGDTLRVEDCKNCGGKGTKKFLVDDKRKVSKKKKLTHLPDEY